MHEQSETIQLPNGKWVNVYGQALPTAGQRLPGTPDYPSVREAVAAAVARSEAHGHEAPSTGKSSKQNEGPEKFITPIPKLDGVQEESPKYKFKTTVMPPQARWQPENPAVAANYNEAMARQKAMAMKVLNGY